MSMQQHSTQQHQLNFTGAFEKVAVKQERPDEAEIRELAAKMVEANKAKIAAGTPGASQRSGMVAGQPNLPGILGYLTTTKRPSENTTPKPSVVTAEGKVPLDDESLRGHFGWITFDKCHIPCIYRGGEKYCSVRILETKLLNKYLSYLHSDIYSCTCIKSYYITEAESKLFNEINMRHCEGQFGKEQFTVKDLVVRVADAKEFYTFLDVCYTKLTAGQNAPSSSSSSSSSGIKSEKCGFIRINKESVVPYTVKDNLKYVPLFYFEGETDNLKLKAEKLEGWDLSYLKFCCKVQGIRNELFASETCSVISLSDIKSYFPPGTGFEDYWPSKVMDSQLFVSSKGGSGSGGWTKQPPTPPATKSSQQIQNNSNKSSLNSRLNTHQNMVPRTNSSVGGTTTLHQQVNQQRQTITTHPSHLSPNTVSSVRSNSNNNNNNNNNNSAQSMLNVVPTVVNGWSGLVGGQPTFQTSPLVSPLSQPNSIIRMQNPSLGLHNQIQSANKSYQQQQQQQQHQQSRSRPSSSGAPSQYPAVYPTTTIQAVPQAQPPPLVRATVHSNQSNLGYPTYGKDDWSSGTYTTPSLAAPNAVSASTYPQMFNLSTEHVQALLHPATSASNLMSHSQRHTPPVHNSSHPKFPPALIPVNGSSNSSRDSRVRGGNQLTMIAESVTTNCQVQPYGLQKALVEGKMVPCINFKPYNFKEMLLMTLPDFVSQYFPACDINSCRHVLMDVLGIELYQGNRSQMKMLMDAGKCSSLNEELPLIEVSSIMKYMPQLKYMFNRNIGMPAPAHLSEEHPAKKRQRTS